MEAETISLREGDVYRWRYREPGDDRAWGRYHCCSNIGIVDSAGRLRDTYWMIGTSFPSDGRSFAPNRLPELELTRLANLADLEKAPEYQRDYYDDADIVDLNHANSTGGNFYVRKGAKRSAEKMLEAARRRLERAQSDQRAAVQRAEQLRATIARIEAGEIETVYL